MLYGWTCAVKAVGYPDEPSPPRYPTSFTPLPSVSPRPSRASWSCRRTWRGSAQPINRSPDLYVYVQLPIYIYIYRSRPSPRYPLPGHVMSADLEGLGPTTRAHDQPFARSISICITPDLVYIYIYIPHAPPLCIPSRQSRASWSCRRTSRGSA